jgi:hypothetical protein
MSTVVVRGGSGPVLKLGAKRGELLLGFGEHLDRAYGAGAVFGGAGSRFLDHEARWPLAIRCLRLCLQRHSFPASRDVGV